MIGNVAEIRGVDPALTQDATRAVRFGLALIAVTFLGVGGWAALAPIAGAVIVPGAVKVDTNRRTVQHQEGGIVKEILVRDGDRVRAGQALIVLDDVRVDAALDQLRTQVDAERARGARLTAEQALADRISLPADLEARAARETRVAEIVRRERTLFDARRQTLREQIALLRRQQEQADEETAALRSQIAAESRGLALQREELAANRRLHKDGYVGEMRVNSIDRATADYEARVGERQAELAKARQKAAELTLRAKTLENQFRQAAADELKESTNKLFELEERLRPSRDAAERQRIVAPIDGEVVDLKVTSAGGVIGPRDPLLDIVPADGRLVVEGRIRIEDIDHLRMGAAADVRFTAFKSRTTPTVVGAVSYLGADRLVDRATNTPYYPVHIEVSPEALRAAGGIALKPGMPAEVFIRTASRTTLQYLFEPFTAFMHRAVREP
jgi:HlyD family type I secretion membrane fusion protein